MKFKERNLKSNRDTEMELFGYEDFFRQQYWNNYEKAKFRNYTWLKSLFKPTEQVWHLLEN